MSQEEVIAAHKHSSLHAQEILDSDTVGCFYCISMFVPSEIKEWCDDGATAICPFCGIDSVIGSKSGYPITLKFLQKMYQQWFAKTVRMDCRGGQPR